MRSAWRASDEVGERRPLDQFHHERMYAARLLQAVYLRDVRMVQGCERLRLALEAREPVRVVREGVREHLDGDLAPERRVAGAIDLAHAAGAEGGEDGFRSPFIGP